MSSLSFCLCVVLCFGSLQNFEIVMIYGSTIGWSIGPILTVGMYCLQKCHKVLCIGTRATALAGRPMPYGQGEGGNRERGVQIGPGRRVGSAMLAYAIPLPKETSNCQSSSTGCGVACTNTAASLHGNLLCIGLPIDDNWVLRHRCQHDNGPSFFYVEGHRFNP